MVVVELVVQVVAGLLVGTVPTFEHANIEDKLRNRLVCPNLFVQLVVVRLRVLIVRLVFAAVPT